MCQPNKLTNSSSSLNRILLHSTKHYLVIAFLGAILISLASAELRQKQHHSFSNRTSAASETFRPFNAITQQSSSLRGSESRLDERQIMPSQQSPKFSTTNELDVFLDDMNHNELRTVASGQPIGDFFRHKAGPGAHQVAAAAAASMDNRKQRVLATSETSRGEIYSECALILQRTFVKNLDDSK